MEILQVSQVINAEFSHIQHSHQDILDQQEAASIFNSVMTCLTGNLAETLQFAVVDRQNPSQVFVMWEYDLSDNRDITRTGPDLRRILEVLKKIRKGRAQLISEVRWSNHFLSMDRRSKEQILSNIYWGKKTDESQKKTDRTKSLVETTVSNVESQLKGAKSLIDFGPLELELLKLETDFRYLNKKEREVIYESVKRNVLHGYCQGVSFTILGSDRESLIAQWKFELDSSSKLIRTGDNQERVLALLEELGNRLPMNILLIPTQSFEELSPKEKQETMKDTIWVVDYKKRGLFG